MMVAPTRKQVLVWGSSMILLGIARLLAFFVSFNHWTWIALLTAIGCGVLGIYLTDRSDWSMLLLTYIMWVISGLLTLAATNILPYEASAIYVLPAIALPFGVAFVRDRRRWWALLVAYSLLAVAIMVGLIGIGVLNNLLIAAYVLLAVACPFLAAYKLAGKQWWFLIPGGICAVVGVSFLIVKATALGAVALILIGGGILIERPTFYTS